jgi:hypothetical protein
MKRYPESAWERAMKVQEVILRAMAKRLSTNNWSRLATVLDWNRAIGQRQQQLSHGGV